jgi:hypothetical protein
MVVRGRRGTEKTDINREKAEVLLKDAACEIILNTDIRKNRRNFDEFGIG